MADIVRTTMGPRSMLKMILDPMGGIVVTNDGNAILREVDVQHPAAKSVIELGRAQDEEVGDGTTAVVVLSGELLSVAEQYLASNMHPTVIVSGYLKAMEDATNLMESYATTLNLADTDAIIAVIDSCLCTKFSSRWGSLVSKLALKAAQTVSVMLPNGKKEIDIKRYARVEKVPGGELEDSVVLDGVMLNKDVTHPKMRRYIKNPRIILLDCPLEYKKGESQTNVEVFKEEEWANLLKQEELEVQKMCDEIIRVGCDVVFTEKGVSDLAQHFLMKAGITAIRRVKKTDNNRLSRVSGATIVNRPEELTSADVGTKAGLFKVEKMGDEYFSYITECSDPQACTVILRGGSKDVLNEFERNFQDAVNVARNILLEPKLLPGGGAIEMELAARLTEMSKNIEVVDQWPYKAVAKALEVIPRTLAQNCGADVVRVMTELRAKHATPKQGLTWGIDGNTGKVSNVVELGIWDTFVVKEQALKTALEASCMLLRIDDILSGIAKKKETPSAKAGPEGAEEEQN